MDNVQHTSYTPIPTQGFTDHETILTSEHLQTLEGGVIKNDSELSEAIKSTNDVNHMLDEYLYLLKGTRFFDYGYMDNDYTTDNITRRGMTVKINQTLSSTTDTKLYAFKISNNFQTAYGQTEISNNLTNPIVLEDKHTYLYVVKLIGGSVSKQFAAQVFNSGAYTVISGGSAYSAPYSFLNFTYDSSAHPNGVHLTFTVNTKGSNVVFNNAVFECMLIDITSSGDQNIAPLNGAYALSEYSSGALLFDSGNLRKATSNIPQNGFIYNYSEPTTIAQELALKADIQQLTAEASARSSADTNVVNIINNMNAGLIEYGYTNNPMSLSKLPNTSNSNTYVSRQGTRFTITGNFGQSSAQAAYKLSNDIAYASNASDVRNFTNTIKLQDGHTYRWYVHYVSGTLTTSSESARPIYPAVYVPNTPGTGIVDSIATFVDAGGPGFPYNDAYGEFTYNAALYPNGVNLCARIGRYKSISCSFADAVFDFYLYDITPGLPALPTSAGTYVLKVTVSDNIPTYSWQATT